MDTSLPAKVGEVVAGYSLDALLGQGGMGAVYKATHVRLGRKVALKMLAGGLAAESEFVSRFLSEAKIVNDVRHPNIVDIFDFIEIEAPRRVAYVMELIDGPSLGALLRERRLSLIQAVNVSLQLSSALEAVHALKVVHRDLKPENVLVVGDPASELSAAASVKILDFGIAKSGGGNAQHKTVTGSMLGTPSYMAPEQIAAEPVSPATDVYALGEILYEMLTGHRLFRGDQLQVLRQKLVGEPPPLELPADLPAREEIAALIRGCLELRPEQRPSLGAFVAALEGLRSRAQVAGAPTESWRRPPPQEPSATPVHMASQVLRADAGLARGRGLMVAGLGALGLALLALGLWRSQDEQPVSAPLAPPAAESTPRVVPRPDLAESSPGGVVQSPPPAQAVPPAPQAAPPPQAPAVPERMASPAEAAGQGPARRVRPRAGKSAPPDPKASEGEGPSAPLKRKQLVPW